jgi:RNA polymerase sigma-70 factor, ECF subfamily
LTHTDFALWLERCRAGDPGAVEALVQTHRPAIYRLAVSILDDPAEADEAAQETFLAALRALSAYRGDAAFNTWLYRIAVNVCRGRLRQGRAWQRLKDALQAAQRWWGEAPPTPEAAAARRQTEAAVFRAVQALGEKHRLPVILRYYHGLSVAEIAEVLSVNEGTVHSRLSIARERLRGALRGEVGLVSGKEGNER